MYLRIVTALAVDYCTVQQAAKGSVLVCEWHWNMVASLHCSPMASHRLCFEWILELFATKGTTFFEFHCKPHTVQYTVPSDFLYVWRVYDVVG